jgi:putative membrane protein
MSASRTLILNVDRDDDIGFKADIMSPVIGRDACLDAAIRLALADAEDSDVNAIFQTIATYDRLKKEGEDIQIALIGGNHFRFVEGDRKIGRELSTIVSQEEITECILVTDGGEDEYILPIIQSRIPVTSVQRVVVNQMPNLEGTYYIIKKVISDPKMSKVVLVLPGLVLLLYAICYALNRPEIATILIAAAVGAYCLYKGLALDELLKDEIVDLKSTLNRGRFSFVTSIGALIFTITALQQGLQALNAYWDGSGIFPMALLIVWGSMLWFMIAGIIASLGPIIDGFLYDKDHMIKVIFVPFFISAVCVCAYGASSYLLADYGFSEFPIAPDTGMLYIIFGAISGLISPVIGLLLQHSIHRHFLERGLLKRAEKTT